MKLQIERQSRGWSRAELARRAGLNPSTVSLIEAGRLIPYTTQLEKLCGALGLPPSDAAQLCEAPAGPLLGSSSGGATSNGEGARRR